MSKKSVSRNVAVIVSATGVVENVILATADFKWPDNSRMLIASESARIGDTYDKKSRQFIAAPEPDMTIEQARGDIHAAINAKTFEVGSMLPIEEKLLWTAKEIDAREWRGGKAATDLLTSEANAADETINDLVDKIIRKSDAHRKMVATLTGIRRQFETAAARAAPSEIRKLYDGAIAAIDAVGKTG